jgi:cysteinyl-tRNA synthetase
VSVLFDLATEVNRTRSTEAARLCSRAGGVLGLLQQSPKAYLQGGPRVAWMPLPSRP